MMRKTSLSLATSSLLLSLVLGACNQSPRLSSPEVSQQAMTSASDDAMVWLNSQYRTNGTSSCVDSYQDDKDIAYTYDMALAVHAYLLKNDQGKAKNILDSFKARQLSDFSDTSQWDGGSWYAAYHCNTGSTSWTPFHEEKFTDVGPTAWVALAAIAYRKKYNDAAYDDMIIRAAEYMSRNQWKTQWGGDGGVNFASNRLQTVSSTEHNLDAFAIFKNIQLIPALNTLANQRLTGDFSVGTSLGNADHFLRNQVWNSAELRLNGGRGDTKFPTDMLSWGAPAFGPYNDNLYYSVVRHIVENTNPSHQNAFNVNGYGTQYAVDFIARTSDKDSWFEGTGQMIVALKMASKFYRSKGWSSAAIDSKMNTYLNAMKNVQAYTKANGYNGMGSYNGGLPYSWNGTNNTYFTMLKNPSVAATTWLIFAEAGYNSFYPDFVNFY
ncbi:hypothetical protein [Deinococcus cellulosilyticus]|uniref:Membrane protein n=1 Tax=Deinococcus cellulosilyticus (strain DSM 18568 / NBRC 106333 / KACC 11606 / 5516J-15) TaxID=1223518 RepID=A0A511N4W1_DEIC1|nr:hypothetical protein [Deinococcus cellulosilyticus]GEM47882.1 membrane protein [Deinococcus cellulosilyticus NBRC 106333 = KACC 11606]